MFAESNFIQNGLKFSPRPHWTTTTTSWRSNTQATGHIARTSTSTCYLNSTAEWTEEKVSNAPLVSAGTWCMCVVKVGSGGEISVGLAGHSRQRFGRELILETFSPGDSIRIPLASTSLRA